MFEPDHFATRLPQAERPIQVGPEVTAALWIGERVCAQPDYAAHVGLWRVLLALAISILVAIGDSEGRSLSSLRGTKVRTAMPRDRCVFIYGMAEEKRIGRRASFGCIRMKSKDVMDLYNRVHIGTPVTISEKRLAEFLPVEEPTLLARQD